MTGRFNSQVGKLRTMLPILLLSGATAAFSQILDTAQAGDGYRTQGEYYGTVGGKPYGIQVIDFSGGKFDMNILPGGLPGQGWGSNIKDFVYLKSVSNGPSGTVFAGSGWTISIPKGGNSLTGTGPGNAAVTMDKVRRDSPTLGMAPPEGATVLYDGTPSTYSANWTGKAPYLINGVRYLSEGNNSKKNFADHTLHLEFRPPYEPENDGQERGNSGVYVQGNYECQVLDSYGWMRGSQENGSHGGSEGWAGGLYAWSKPRFNMSHPPLTWQTYDVYMTNATFNGGNKSGNAHMTVYLNGYMVQDTMIAGSTPGGGSEAAAGGKLYVQDHGGPLWYKNIWIMPGKDFVPIPPMPSLGNPTGIDPMRNTITPLRRSNRLLVRLSPDGTESGPALFDLNGGRVSGYRRGTAAGLYISPAR